MKNLSKVFSCANSTVERAIIEARRGAPVLLHDGCCYALMLASELLCDSSLKEFTSFSAEVHLILTANRLKFLFGTQLPMSRLLVNGLSIQEVTALLTLHPENTSVKPADLTHSKNTLDKLAIDIVKMAELLPSAIVVDMDFKSSREMTNWCAQNNVMHLERKGFYGYTKKYDLYEVCSSELTLQNAPNSRIMVYRSNIGEPEHYAIIIGYPKCDNPVVRIHSSCYTGDLLGSLSCDCRSQLLTAVKFLGESEGGIILYISQEGRGIGLTNKIRAYNLQRCNALDTVDANRFLGFDDDERVLAPAAIMLKKLNISQFQLLTNNPDKMIKMRSYGLSVTQMIPFTVEVNEHNSAYVKTKIERLGHFA